MMKFSGSESKIFHFIDLNFEMKCTKDIEKKRVREHPNFTLGATFLKHPVFNAFWTLFDVCD